MKTVRDEYKITLIPESKIEEVANYTLYKAKEITPLTLHKLLYYAQGFNLAFTRKPLIDDDCEASLRGPLYRNIYNQYKVYGSNPIEDAIVNFKYNDLNSVEIELINIIVSNFSCYSGKVLRKLIYGESLWIATRGSIKVNEHEIISKDLIRDYFTQVIKKYKMINMYDIKDYSKDLFSKIS